MFVKTMQQAKRLIKIVFGFTLTLLGFVMLFTPGPGWAAIIGGLALLAAEFVWARRLLNRIKSSAGRVRDAVWTPNAAKSGNPPPAADAS
jgi:uncharacterized protein (TIGR02611 family)